MTATPATLVVEVTSLPDPVVEVTDQPDVRVDISATGLQGPPGRLVASWRGPWSAFITYSRGDVVSSGGSTWVTLADTPLLAPPASPWQLVAAGIIDVTSITLPEIATPLPPPASSHRFYFKVDGLMYALDSAGNETLVNGELHTEAHDYSYFGPLQTTSAGGSVLFPYPVVFHSVRASVTSAPLGSPVILDLFRDGVTAYTTQANRPTIPAGSLTSSTAAPDVTSFPAGSALGVSIAAVGSGYPGSTLVATVRVRRLPQ